ncbi:MAG: flagellar basal body L-ring protein FlgH [Thermoguttaceae bacterium]|jgi:flagellar L-ring protein precursor FlgH
MKLASLAILRASVLGVLALAGAGAERALGQNSSLFHTSPERQPLTLTSSSWTSEEPAATKTIKINDLVTVIVSEKSAMTNYGKMDRQKMASGNLSLTAWLKFYGANLGADGQPNGTPQIAGTANNQMQSKGDLQTRDSLSFHIACRVADIRPNGNLVLEGRRTINNNEENWDYALTGEIRADAVLPNHTVLSDSVADLRVIKRETGEARDSYRRGWMLKWLDKWQPF